MGKLVFSPLAYAKIIYLNIDIVILSHLYLNAFPPKHSSIPHKTLVDKIFHIFLFIIEIYS
jgi:hypothetical protein